MRSLHRFAVLTSSSFFALACSLDTEQLSFDGAAGANAQAGNAGQAAARSAGQAASGAGGSMAGGAGEAGKAGEAGNGGEPAGGKSGSGGISGNGGTAGQGGVAGGAAAGGGGSAGAGGDPNKPCTAEIEGLQRCTGATVETCTSDVWTPAAAACEQGCIAKGLTAVCKVCTPDAKSCNGAVPQTCSKDGTKLEAAATGSCSGATPACNPTTGLCSSCAPGEKTCVSGSALTCSESGAFDVAGAVDCGGPSLCKVGEGCIAGGVCTTGQLKCPDSTHIEYCAADLKGYDAAKPCPTGSTCDVALGCVQCTANSTVPVCQGDDVVVCDAGVRTVVAQCAAGGCAGGACSSCDPGTGVCLENGTQVAKCNTMGKYDAPVTCAGGTFCDSNVGSCVQCVANKTACNGDALVVCDATGTIKSTTACGAGLCDAVAQGCDICLPGKLRCEGQFLQTCLGDGTGYDAGTDCFSLKLCNIENGRCDAPVCEAGVRSCGPGRAPRTCKADRSGYDEEPACRTSCVDGSCEEISSISTGANQSCAIVGKAGRVFCWGGNPGGNVFGPDAGLEVAPRLMPGLQNIQKIELGGDSACALDRTGNILCWGANQLGQLGDGTTKGRLQPQPVQLDGTAKDLSVSSAGGACAVTDANRIYCWGRKAAPGKDPPSYDVLPVSVPLEGKPGSVSVGVNHRCYTFSDGGAAYCWGLGNNGQLGNGTTLSTPVPTGQVETTDNKPIIQLLDISASNAIDPHTCAIAGGAAFCWGGNGMGQRGDTDPMAHVGASNVGLKGDVTAISVGAQFSCAIAGKNVVCWGAGDKGQNGSTAATPKPASVPLPATTSLLDTGNSHSCALATDGYVYCWGDNGVGQLGFSSTKDPFSPTPVRVELP